MSPSISIDIQELICLPEGIRIKYEYIHQGKKAEGIYPKLKQEVTKNYASEIDECLKKIAQGLLEVCGLDPETWDNDFLGVTKLRFKFVENAVGQFRLQITGGLKSRNELLGQKQTFAVPKVSEDVLWESELKSIIDQLLNYLEDYYNGKTNYQQTELF